MMHLTVFKWIFNYAEITIVGCILRHTLDEVFRNIHTIVRTPGGNSLYEGGTDERPAKFLGYPPIWKIQLEI